MKVILQSLFSLSMIVLIGLAQSTWAADKTFRAGAAAVDISPTKFPVIVNGMFDERTATKAHDRLMSRALVLDDGSDQLVIVVVDSLMISRELLDQAKE